MLADNPVAFGALMSVFAASQFLSNLLIHTPEYYEILANPTIRDRPRSVEDFTAEGLRRVAIGSTPGMKRDALRRFKPPEVLRAGVRDILGYASVTETVAEISAFAEACVRIALRICEAENDLCVIAMGKLGGRELNYASDIDLVFVHADTLPSRRRAVWRNRCAKRSPKSPTRGFSFAWICACARRAASGRCRAPYHPAGPTTSRGRNPGSARPSSRRGPSRATPS